MSPRILVVDDDAALAEMIGIVLRAEDYEVFFCADGSGALEAFRRARPDLVLLDLMLPGIDGIEVCRAIRAESGVPVIMLTAKSDTSDVVQGLESGADDYMVKPFDPKELVARIKTRLRPAVVAANAVLQVATSASTWPGTRSAAVRSGSASRRSSSTCSSRSPPSPSRCSPARCCSNRSGATTTRQTPVS
ncbi:DNA-binding response regulator MtrA [Rathayibacter tanaceti]|uniref:DNA-binding response regulator MtrA n=1 Tax=Rathayibacter tanaceti TaxID=1671680 RepID=A0A162F7C3_9MICO|nr:DNA-binding response regulator MtrA [Rathayibacter tanaceti]